MYSVGHTPSSAIHFFKSNDAILHLIPLAMTVLPHTFIFYFFLCFLMPFSPF